SAVTTAPNATPITIPTARSTTLPRRTNVRKSLRRAGTAASLGELLLDPLEAFEHQVDLLLFLRRRVEHAFRLERDLLDVVEVEPLAAEARHELLPRDRLPPQRPRVEPAVPV